MLYVLKITRVWDIVYSCTSLCAKEKHLFWCFLLHYSITWNWDFTELEKKKLNIFYLEKCSALRLFTYPWYSVFLFWNTVPNYSIYRQFRPQGIIVLLQVYSATLCKTSVQITYCCYSSSCTYTWKAKFCLLN